MSDEDRKVHDRGNEDVEESTEDVEAHKKEGRAATEESGDDVQAHMREGGRHANDDDNGDDVEAHVKNVRQ